MQRRLLQAKLTVSEPGDLFEQEADRVADAVMRMPDNEIKGSPPGIQRLCDDCGDELDKEPEEGLGLQAKEVADHRPEVTPAAQAQIDSLGAGRPLLQSERAFFEPRFGHDFGHVRLHTDSRAARTAQSMHALAYTRGSDIVFGPGQFQLNTTAGQRLLAHELAHVVQQHRAPPGALLRQACPPSPVEEPDHELTCTDITRDPGELDRFAANGPLVETLAPGECFLLMNLRSGGTDFGTPPEFDEWADRLRFDTTVTVHLTGYTDCLGSAATNANLRMNRASAVEDYLVDVLGVDRDVVLVETASATEYVDSNETAEGRARNRSVLLSFETPVAPAPACRPPYDVTYAPSSANCAAYQGPLAENWLTFTYRHNAECACENTPNNPRNNCVRKCLQEKMRGFLISQQRSGGVIGTCLDPFGMLDPLCPEPFCSTLYEHHVDCYGACCCGSPFIAYPFFLAMCEMPFPCTFVEHSISWFNECT